MREISRVSYTGVCAPTFADDQVNRVTFPFGASAPGRVPRRTKTTGAFAARVAVAVLEPGRAFA